MGIVLSGYDGVLDRKVAIKFLRSDLRLDTDERVLLMQRMMQEARAVARLNHPGIVALYDLGESPTHGVYLVFEQATGHSLEMALSRGRLTSEGVARLARELGEALTHAHERGVVHRDIKPANLILTEHGVKIADFGVARLPESTLTRAGARVGTPAYSAPETLASGKHSPLSDQFSLAATLYEALSGKRAFEGQDAVTVARRIERENPLPIAKAVGAPEAIDTVLFRGMNRNPAARYPNCRALGAAVSEVLTGRLTQPTLTEGALLPHIPKERPASQQVGLIVLCLLLGATATLAVERMLSDAQPSSKSP